MPEFFRIFLTFSLAITKKSNVHLADDRANRRDIFAQWVYHISSQAHRKYVFTASEHSVNDYGYSTHFTYFTFIIFLLCLYGFLVLIYIDVRLSIITKIKLRPAVWREIQKIQIEERLCDCL